MRHPARVPLVLVALAASWGLLLAAPVRADQGLDLEAPRGAREPVLTLRGMTYVASRGESNEVVLDAARARVLPEQDVAHLEEVRAKLSAVDGDGALDLTCERGTFRMSSGDFLAEGNVRGTTGDGRRFVTNSLNYRHGQSLVTTDHPVVIRDGTGTYRGGGFRYHVRENRFRLLGGAMVVQEQ